MSTPLPPPFITPDIDVRDLDGFMLNAERILASELLALSTGDEFKAAVRLWCRAWKQMPAASLPNDDRILASFAGLSLKPWMKVRDMALRGFVLCSDGRLYHRLLCDDARRAYQRKLERRERTVAATEARKNKRNDQREEQRYVEQNHNVTLSQGQGQGQGQDISTSPPSSVVSRAKPEITATTGDDKPDIQPGKPEPGLGRKAQASVTHALRIGLTTGNAQAIVAAFSVTPGHDVEWVRETDGMALGEVAAVLAWQRALKSPVRLPSGFVKALATWRSLELSTRRHLAAVHLGNLGIETGIVLEKIDGVTA